MNLVLVESPTKAKTLSRFLGDDYQVRATYGHLRDLPEKKLGVEVKKDFEPIYEPVAKQKERIIEIKALGENAKKIYLATDPDREGEAIAWHAVNVLDKPQAEMKRIEFHEITESAIREALAHPRSVDMRLVEAQQGRRVLDRLVGYKLSPLLWKKVRRGLSAGRVQSVAVRLVVEREREIEAFVPEEYWNILVQLAKRAGDSKQFSVNLVALNEEKLEVASGEVAQQVVADLRNAKYRVADVTQKAGVKSPPAPFTTSMLQQTAANKLGWSAKKTMQVAQMLYEQGFITYHRTDSTNLAVEAVREVGAYINTTFGREYGLDIPRMYKTKSKVAQEAHEAIRPTQVKMVKLQAEEMNRDQERLYELIWKRFVACQMAEARILNTKAAVNATVEQKTYGLEAKGEQVTFDGWLKIYLNQGKKNKNEEEEDEEEESKYDLPQLLEGEELSFVDVASEQKFTQPPARFNDASLIKALEERGIGRPSTYAPILSTIQDRQYVERIEKRFKPTSLGIAVNDFLVGNFPKIVDYGFTAEMEDNLDEIANGARNWRKVIGDFYKPFEETLQTVAETAKRVQVEVEETGNACPKCGEGREVIRLGRFGKFVACSRYPDCDYKNNYVEKAGMPCPKCGGEVIMRRTKTRRSFFGCSNYPNCDFASWTKPKPAAPTVV